MFIQVDSPNNKSSTKAHPATSLKEPMEPKESKSDEGEKELVDQVGSHYC